MAQTVPRAPDARAAADRLDFTTRAFLFAIMFISSQDRFTVPVGLRYLLGEFGTISPVTVLFAYVQRFLLQGLSGGRLTG